MSSQTEFDDDLSALSAARELDKEKAAQTALGGDKPPAPEAEGGFTRWTKNLPRNIGVGLLDAALNTLDAVQPEKPDAAEEGASQGTFTAGMYTPPTSPAQQRMGLMDDEHGRAVGAVVGFRNAMARGSRTSDHITQGVAQFVVPFTGWMKAFQGVRAATNAPKVAQVVGKIGQAAGAEAATMSTAFDPHAGRLADLVEFGKQTEGKLADALNTLAPDGSAVNAYFDYMTSREDETDAEGRFKNVVDSLAGSAVIASVLKAGAVSFRSARAFADSPITLPEIGAPKQLPEVAMSAADEAEAMRLQGQNFDTALSNYERQQEELLAQRTGMRIQTAEILDELATDQVSPRDVAKQFWDVTYDAIRPDLQRRFQQYAEGLGYGADSDEGTTAFFSKLLPSDATKLEGNSRGIVAQMRWMNEQLNSERVTGIADEALAQFPESPHAAMVQLTEQADNVLDDAERTTILAARERVAAGLPDQGYTVVPSPEGHTVVSGKQPVLTFTSEEDAVAAVADAQKLLGTNFQQRAAVEHAKASDANFATLHSFSRVLATNKDRPVSTHSLLSALERNLKGDTEQGAFYKELLGRLVRKKLGGTTTVVSKGGKTPDSAGHFATAFNQIELYDKAFSDPKRLIHTFAHEAVHAATMHEMNASAAVMRKMEALRKAAHAEPLEQRAGIGKALQGKPTAAAPAAKEDLLPLTGRAEYGFTNAYEFVAEIEANPEFRKLMQKTQLPEGGTAWDKYLETIAGILGIGSLVATPTGLKEFSKLMMGPKPEEKQIG